MNSLKKNINCVRKAKWKFLKIKNKLEYDRKKNMLKKKIDKKHNLMIIRVYDSWGAHILSEVSEKFAFFFKL